MNPVDSVAIWLAVIAQIGAIILALINRKGIKDQAVKSDDQHAETKVKIEEVRRDVNGKMQQLLQVTGDAREAKGNLAGVAEEKAKHEHEI